MPIQAYADWQVWCKFYFTIFDNRITDEKLSMLVLSSLSLTRVMLLGIKLFSSYFPSIELLSDVEWEMKVIIVIIYARHCI